jgi:hypothetical protein
MWPLVKDVGHTPSSVIMSTPADEDWNALAAKPSQLGFFAVVKLEGCNKEFTARAIP